jgi:hypothetical protein
LRASTVERNYHTSAASSVVQFRSRVSALAYALTFARLFPQSVKRFAVPGIPNAVGLADTPQAGGAFDVLFADGPFSYDLTVFTNDPSKPPTAAQVAAEALRWYRRVHGHA